MSNAWIENHDGRLRIRCRHSGKTKTISLGIEDGKAQRGYALSILGQVKLDLSLNQFYDSLLKHKPKTLGTQATELNCPELFQRFLKHKIERCLSNGAQRRYSGVLSHSECAGRAFKANDDADLPSYGREKSTIFGVLKDGF
jgi:integrase